MVVTNGAGGVEHQPGAYRERLRAELGSKNGKKI